MSKARQAIPTVTFVDEYCQLYQDLFPDVRSFEHFKYLLVGMLSELKRKTRPELAVEIIKEWQQWGFRRERGAGGQAVWGEKRFCQRTGEAAPQVCRGDPLQSWRLVATRSTRTVHELATVCTSLLQWEAANPLHPRDRLWAARAHSLLPPHDRPPHVASDQHVAHHLH